MNIARQTQIIINMEVNNPPGARSFLKEKENTCAGGMAFIVRGSGLDVYVYAHVVRGYALKACSFIGFVPLGSWHLAKAIDTAVSPNVCSASQSQSYLPLLA